MSLKKPLIISCGSLKKEIEELLRTGSLDADLVFLSVSLHMDFNDLEQGLEEELSKHVREGRKIVVVYGDFCHPRMREIVEKYGAIKVDAINCLDCLLGGKGRLYELDPQRSCFYLSPGWIKFLERMPTPDNRVVRRMFQNLEGIIIIESLGKLDSEKIKKFAENTGLKVIKHEIVGLQGLKSVIEEALNRV
ncbi:MAG: DUF1638 domain-containing protein [Candidatus Jordarchaeum sp.]|uniref:DUF1638 domain-containing protein n=1 Tax=Candidatus Jordarchaeum sp. TaxID=2823881 RepID=UPI0040494A36